MPPNLEETNVFPRELEGKYLKKNKNGNPVKGNFNGYVFYEVVRVNDKHIIIYEYEESSLSKVVNESNKNEYQLLDNALIIKKEESIGSIENLQFLENDIIRFPKIKSFDIDLEKQLINLYQPTASYESILLGEKEQLSMLIKVKVRDNKLFLNLAYDTVGLLKVLWYTVQLDFDNGDIIIKQSNVDDGKTIMNNYQSVDSLERTSALFKKYVSTGNIDTIEYERLTNDSLVAKFSYYNEATGNEYITDLKTNISNNRNDKILTFLLFTLFIILIPGLIVYKLNTNKKIGENVNSHHGFYLALTNILILVFAIKFDHVFINSRTGFLVFLVIIFWLVELLVLSMSVIKTFKGFKEPKTSKKIVGIILNSAILLLVMLLGLFHFLDVIVF
tara:strand:+ start:2929 stop:4095 length:1167 start_codon:yes stop_codon:yes gene_type:complete